MDASQNGQVSAVLPPKIMVAVHGIGEQTAYETAQSVAFRVFGHYDVPPALPLGHFHNGQVNLQDVATPDVMIVPPSTSIAVPFGFAEMYWADVPRKLVKEGYTLEEAKRWARTLIARLNLNAAQAGQPLSKRQYQMLRMVLDELIDAVFVLESLAFLAARAGLFKFKLKKLLDDFLNDVQVATDFQKQRSSILDRFHRLMTSIIDHHPDAELYLVAHSEGSVIAFLAILDGLAKTDRPKWVEQLRGLMTIGSPIEVHHLLWSSPPLWPRLPANPCPLARKIEWWNYYDTGDPIAYRLSCTRAWLKESRWQQFFDFPDSHDVEFARYPLPGKAHVDYWTDEGVFGHFIETVVAPSAQVVAATASMDLAVPSDGRHKRRAARTPRTIRWWEFVSVVAPYALVLALMFVAVFALYKPLTTAMGVVSMPARHMARDLAGFTLLITGMTMVVRAPRLTRLRISWFLWPFAALVFYAGLWAYHPLVAGVTPPLVRSETSDLIETALTPWLNVVPFQLGGSAFITLVVLATAVSAVWSWFKPARGVRPLMVIGGATTAIMVLSLLLLEAKGSGAVPTRSSPDIWPLVLGGLLFLYLWWLATLILDLTIVWHSHVRWSGAIVSMRNMTHPGWNRTGKAVAARQS